MSPELTPTVASISSAPTASAAPGAGADIPRSSEHVSQVASPVSTWTLESLSLGNVAGVLGEWLSVLLGPVLDLGKAGSARLAWDGEHSFDHLLILDEGDAEWGAADFDLIDVEEDGNPSKADDEIVKVTGAEIGEPIEPTVEKEVDKKHDANNDDNPKVDTLNAADVSEQNHHVFTDPKTEVGSETNTESLLSSPAVESETVEINELPHNVEPLTQALNPTVLTVVVTNAPPNPEPETRVLFDSDEIEKDEGINFRPDVDKKEHAEIEDSQLPLPLAGTLKTSQAKREERRAKINSLQTKLNGLRTKLDKFKERQATRKGTEKEERRLELEAKINGLQTKINGLLTKWNNSSSDEISPKYDQLGNDSDSKDEFEKFEYEEITLMGRLDFHLDLDNSSATGEKVSEEIDLAEDKTDKEGHRNDGGSPGGRSLIDLENEKEEVVVSLNTLSGGLHDQLTGGKPLKTLLSPKLRNISTEKVDYQTSSTKINIAPSATPLSRSTSLSSKRELSVLERRKSDPNGLRRPGENLLTERNLEKTKQGLRKLDEKKPETIVRVGRPETSLNRLSQPLVLPGNAANKLTEDIKENQQISRRTSTASTKNIDSKPLPELPERYQSLPPTPPVLMEKLIELVHQEECAGMTYPSEDWSELLSKGSQEYGHMVIFPDGTNARPIVLKFENGIAYENGKKIDAQKRVQERMTELGSDVARVFGEFRISEQNFRNLFVESSSPRNDDSRKKAESQSRLGSFVKKHLPKTINLSAISNAVKFHYLRKRSEKTEEGRGSTSERARDSVPRGETGRSARQNADGRASSAMNFLQNRVKKVSSTFGALRNRNQPSQKRTRETSDVNEARVKTAAVAMHGFAEGLGVELDDDNIREFIQGNSPMDDLAVHIRICAISAEEGSPLKEHERLTVQQFVDVASACEYIDSLETDRVLFSFNSRKAFVTLERSGSVGTELPESERPWTRCGTDEPARPEDILRSERTGSGKILVLASEKKCSTVVANKAISNDKKWSSEALTVVDKTLGESEQIKKVSSEEAELGSEDGDTTSTEQKAWTAALDVFLKGIDLTVEEHNLIRSGAAEAATGITTLIRRLAMEERIAAEYENVVSKKMSSTKEASEYLDALKTDSAIVVFGNPNRFVTLNKIAESSDENWWVRSDTNHVVRTAQIFEGVVDVADATFFVITAPPPSPQSYESLPNASLFPMQPDSIQKQAVAEAMHAFVRDLNIVLSEDDIDDFTKTSHAVANFSDHVSAAADLAENASAAKAYNKLEPKYFTDAAIARGYLNYLRADRVMLVFNNGRTWLTLTRVGSTIAWGSEVNWRRHDTGETVALADIFERDGWDGGEIVVLASQKETSAFAASNLSLNSYKPGYLTTPPPVPPKDDNDDRYGNSFERIQTRRSDEWSNGFERSTTPPPVPPKDDNDDRYGNSFERIQTRRSNERSNVVNPNIAAAMGAFVEGLGIELDDRKINKVLSHPAIAQAFADYISDAAEEAEDGSALSAYDELDPKIFQNVSAACVDIDSLKADRAMLIFNSGKSFVTLTRGDSVAVDVPEGMWMRHDTGAVVRPAEILESERNGDDNIYVLASRKKNRELATKPEEPWVGAIDKFMAGFGCYLTLEERGAIRGKGAEGAEQIAELIRGLAMNGDIPGRYSDVVSKELSGRTEAVEYLDALKTDRAIITFGDPRKYVTLRRDESVPSGEWWNTDLSWERRATDLFGERWVPDWEPVVTTAAIVNQLPIEPERGTVVVIASPPRRSM